MNFNSSGKETACADCGTEQVGTLDGFRGNT